LPQELPPTSNRAKSSNIKGVAAGGGFVYSGP
jgi:hypothetical protein